ncbi:DUF4124 domain-containing protein [Methyloterricola oryzae]|uniref:DUF4124 domain-containing protein n=1 Tax=Methyloterricola oryzae TaxID=1495050 RepID=UPI00069B8B0E|nr:DUF4124 domain-containing protein [Methyloterricola oryzae]
MPQTRIKILLLLAAAVLSATAGAETFRWIDETGNVHYSDQVPPEDAKHQRSRLDKQGREIDVIEGAKTAEQMDQEKRLRSLRAEQRRVLAEQRDRDQSLLRTYGTEQEMTLTLQNKLATVDSVIRVTESNRERQEILLDSQRKRAADAELKGQAVPKILRDSIEAIQRQIAAYTEQINKLEDDKKTINEAFGRDRLRLQELRSAGQDPLQFALMNELKLMPGEMPIVSAVSCRPGPACDKVWEAAKSFIRARSGKPLVTDTSKVLQTAIPLQDQDFSLVVTRSSGKGEDTVFLDARCRLSSLGDELCASPRVREIRAAFATYVQMAVAASP